MSADRKEDRVFVARFSAFRILFLAALGLVFVLLGLFLAGFIGREYVVEDTGLYGVLAGFVAIAIGVCANLSSLRLLLKGPIAVRLNKTGMQVRRYSKRSLPWEAVQGVEYLEIEINTAHAWPIPLSFKKRLIRFWLEPEYHWKISPLDRLMTGRWSRDTGSGYFAIHYNVTDRSLDQFLEALRTIPPEHARIAQDSTRVVA